MKQAIRTIVFLIMIPVLGFCAEEGKNEKEKEVLQALKETADYVSDVLINEDGFSRCDYNIPEG